MALARVQLLAVQRREVAAQFIDLVRGGSVRGGLGHAGFDQPVEGGGVKGAFVPARDEPAVECFGHVAVDESDQAADHEAEGPDVGCRGGVCGLREREWGPRGEDDGFVGGAAEVFVVDFGALVVFGGVEAFGAETDGVGRPESADGFVGH